MSCFLQNFVCLFSVLLCRAGFTVKLMKLKLQGPSLSLVPFKALGAETKFSELSKIQNKFLSTILEERLNYLPILSIENDVTELLSYEEAIKKYVVKK